MGIRTKIARGIITKKGYAQSRMAQMSDEVRHWKDMKDYSRTKHERDLCDKMCAIYLHRYIWYMSR